MTEEIIGRTHRIIIPPVFEGFKYESKLGKGSFAVVILVRRLEDNKLFACKVFSRDFLIENNIVDKFKREVETFSKLNHPNILKLVKILNDDKLIYMIMDYCSKGDLKHYLMNHGQFTEEQTRIIFHDLLSAVSYLHSLSIAHRDLKLDNILIDENMGVKLADFGLCQVAKEEELMKTKCGSPIYTAPEIILQQKYDGRIADMWSCGVILYVLLVGVVPWQDVNNEYQLFFNITTAHYHIPGTVNSMASKLISSLMCPQPEIRITAVEALSHPWFHNNISSQKKGNLASAANRKLLEDNGRHAVKSMTKRTASPFKLRDAPLTRRLSKDNASSLLNQ